MVLFVGVACTVCSHVQREMRNGPTSSILPDEQLIGIFACVVEMTHERL